MGWYTNDSTLRIEMTVDDFGVPLSLDFEDYNFTEHDVLNFVIVDGDTEIISKVFEDIQNDHIELVITAQETELLHIGKYEYRIDWYQGGQFMYNIAPMGVFVVSKKAKGVSA